MDVAVLFLICLLVFTISGDNMFQMIAFPVLYTSVDRETERATSLQQLCYGIHCRCLGRPLGAWRIMYI